MNAEAPTSAVVEALLDRKRQLELEAAQIQARLDEVRDLLGLVNGPRRVGRPRRQPPPETAPDPEPEPSFEMPEAS